MIHKQGAEYKDSTEIEEAIQEDDTSKKKSWKVYVTLAGFGAVIVLVLIGLIVAKVRGDDTKDPPPSDSNSPGIVVGDDAYWDQFEEPGTTFSYTDEEKQQLRAWGYTGDEIEEHESNETSVDELVAASRQEQEEARATLSNPESPEYQALLNNTWLGQQALTIPQYEEGVSEGIIYYDTYTLNADYEKVPAHGHNLLLKVYLEDGSYAFMECPLLRYMQLPDSGNIVVSYQTATIDGATIVSNMKEVTVS